MTDFSTWNRATLEQFAQEATDKLVWNKHQITIAMRQWDNWKAEAIRLNDRLQKYEPGSPLLLNSAAAPKQKETE